MKAKWRGLNALASMMCDKKNKQAFIDRTSELEYLDVLTMILNATKQIEKRKKRWA